MNIKSCNYNSNNSFGSLYNNKLFLGMLEKTAEHPASFIAGTSLVMAAGLRPISVMLTPGVDKENKEYACANSITSAISKFILTEAVALPVENAIKQINKNPEKYLNGETIGFLKGKASSLVESCKYNSLTRIIKLCTGFITAIPKSVITVALIPIVTDMLFRGNNNKQKKGTMSDFVKQNNTPEVFRDITNKPVSFKGGEFLPKTLGRIIQTKPVLNFTKFLKQGNNSVRNVTVATDVLLSASFAFQTANSKKIKKERKKPLIFNNLISTGITLASGCAIDNFIQKGSAKYIKKFSEANPNNPKLAKYIEGINTIRPTLIFALIYYGIFPFISLFAADKTDKFLSGNEQKTNNMKKAQIEEA